MLLKRFIFGGGVGDHGAVGGVREGVALHGALLQEDAAQGDHQSPQGLFAPVAPELALPDDDAIPAHRRQLLAHLLVALTVAADLCLPELRARLRHDEIPAPLVPVPETPVDEDTRPVLAHHDVRLPRQPRMAQPIAEPVPPQIPAHHHLRPRVPTPDRRHIPAPLLRRNPIRHKPLKHFGNC